MRGNMSESRQEESGMRWAGYIVGFFYGIIRRWPRGVKFGLGLSLMLAGLMSFLTIPTIFIAIPLFLPGALLFGAALWPTG